MAATGNPITCTCNGTGKYVVRDEDGFISSISTHLCPCRLDEPPREGKAAWWTGETIKEMEFESATKFDRVTATIERERPVSEDNHRLIRTEDNWNWPAMAVLSAKFSNVGLTADMLRELAAWLNVVAEEVDRIDREIS